MKVIVSLVMGLGVYGLNWFAVAIGWYEKYEWIDVPMHFFGGVVAGLLVIGSIDISIKRVQIVFKNRLLVAGIWWLVIMGGVALIATAWEFHETLMDLARDTNPLHALLTENVHGYHQPNVIDTMIDYVMGFIGGTVAVIGNAIYEKHLGHSAR